MASTHTKGSVLLLKAPRDTEEDHFVEALKEAGFRVSIVPVLSFKFVNGDVLASALSNVNRYWGIIFTSVRAVHAVTQALTEHNKGNINVDPHSLRCFVVGHTTAESARKAGFQPEGEESGNAEKLAEYIHNAAETIEKRVLLYPCAQMRRDTLRDRLKSCDCHVEEVLAYETVPSENIKENIAHVFTSEDCPNSVVYFSPSGVQFTEALVDEGVLPLHSLKVYALGPATQQALLDRNITPAGVASKPDPASLLQLLHQK